MYDFSYRCAGFIGSNFILEWLKYSNEAIVNLDCLSYAGNIHNLDTIKSDPRHIFILGNICDNLLVDNLLKQYKPRAIIHFAAESHVDRSILDPGVFYKTNVFGTLNLIECTRRYYESLPSKDKDCFRFVHISTDEVYGSLSLKDAAFTEYSVYRPNSPYSSSKAASDHIIRAWGKTYNLPVLITHCSNNYGPYQFPEKLIPMIISRALKQDTIPIYGDGKNIRDWLYVTDHCSAIRCILEKGTVGSVYNIGGCNEKMNIEVVEVICDIMDKAVPLNHGSYRRFISFIKDRPGHDRRYAIDASRLKSDLGWSPSFTFDQGITQTVNWYLKNNDWLNLVTSGEYRKNN